MLSASTTLLVCALATASAGCGQGNLASSLAKAPSAGGDFESKCTATKTDEKPLVVALPSGDRAAMEALAKSGPLVVSYRSCQLGVLSRCKLRGKYNYSATTLKKDNVSVKNEDDLYARIPLGAVSLTGKLRTFGSVSVAMAVVGRFDSDLQSPAHADLEGDCEGATHWAAALTVGAYKMAAGAEAQIGADVSILGAQAGGHSSSTREVLSEDGDGAACGKSNDGDARPPPGCGALLRVELVALKGGPR